MPKYDVKPVGSVRGAIASGSAAFVAELRDAERAAAVGRGGAGAAPIADDDDLLSAVAIAERLGISARTFARWLASGAFPAPDLRIGRVLRWRVSTYRRWVASSGA